MTILTNMKSNRFKIFATLFLLIVAASTVDSLRLNAEESGSAISLPPSVVGEASAMDSLTAFKRRQLKYAQRWENLIPKYFKTQFAGGMGLLSFGTGWEYGKNGQWETDLLLGFIPKHSSKHARATMTLKQNFTPWNLPIKKGFFIEPLSTGIYLNTVFGGEFWSRNPDKYPKGYYWFSTRLRIHAFIGQRFRYNIPERHRHFCSSITAFYELSTCDLYVIQAVRNSYLRPRDFLRLSFGLKFNFF